MSRLSEIFREADLSGHPQAAESFEKCVENGDVDRFEQTFVPAMLETLLVRLGFALSQPHALEIG